MISYSKYSEKKESAKKEKKKTQLTTNIVYKPSIGTLTSLTEKLSKQNCTA